ncbi:hypothetical protein PROFUN_05441 [Planoprotostelium fungivorum]|uniref:Transmembrane protein n=1 Tax=Planoprotostelium fungivorum TaxID=1890364 RepID=A0A2P6NQT0_9EUKA|nr:hypothetical protein PROFUN_05441 [Planoprotostelium fungivorum]
MMIPFLILLVGSVALGLASWIVSFPWKESVSKRREEVALLFEENYIGSWRFEPQTWRDFVKHHFQWKEKLMWIAIVLIVFPAPMSPTLALSSPSLSPHLCASALIIYTFLYPRFEEEVYTPWSLQPATKGPDFTAYSLMSVNLQEKMMDTTVLRLETKTRDNVEYLLIEVPVPDQFVQNVKQWVKVLAEGYTDDV